MGSFLLCILQYVIIAAVIAVIAFCGAKIGIALRRKKDAKEAASEPADKE